MPGFIILKVIVEANIFALHPGSGTCDLLIIIKLLDTICSFHSIILDESFGENEVPQIHQNSHNNYH